MEHGQLGRLRPQETESGEIGGQVLTKKMYMDYKYKLLPFKLRWLTLFRCV